MIKNLNLEGHTLFGGTTGYGKTTLAKSLCKFERLKGKFTFVLDPVLHSDWGSHYITDNMDIFINTVWNYAEKYKIHEKFLVDRKPLFSLYIDEAGDYTPKDWHSLRKFLKKGRNYGIVCRVIGQRVYDINKSARTQCESFVISGQTEEDIPILRTLAKSRKFDICANELFPKLHYVIKEGSGKPIKFAVWKFDARRCGGGSLMPLEKIEIPS